jgi:hypothetical protein
MCWQCDHPDGDYDGYLIGVIDEHGWAVSGVEASTTEPGWLYTVGLPVRFGHPELLIGGSSTDSHQVLDGIAAYIRDSGRRIEPGQLMKLGDRVYGFAAVSAERLRSGELQASLDVHRVLGIAEVEALEVMRIEELEYCEHRFDEALRELST